MESNTGKILTLISSIIFFIGAFIVFLIFIIMLFAVLSGAEFETEGISQETANTIMLVLLFVLFMAVFVVAMLSLKASRMMQDPRTTSSGGKLALVLGILTFWTFAGILNIIGGAIAIGDAKKSQAR